MSMTEFFTEDHRKIDGLLLAFKDSLARGQPDWTVLAQVQQRLHRHIYWEEEILFPAVESRGIRGPTQVMSQEHGEICDLLDRLTGLLSDPAPVAELRRTLTSLTEVLWSHNQKEEGILYPASDDLMEETASRSILERISNETPPPQWQCQVRRR